MPEVSKAEPVVTHDVPPIELPAEPETVVKETVDSPVPQQKLDRSRSVRTLMTTDERRKIIDERRRSRQLQRTESGRFVEGVDYQTKQSKPSLVRTQSVLLTRVSRVEHAKSKNKSTYNAICNEYPDLIAEVIANPWATTGRGSPELLSGNFAGCISRRLNEKDRLVYRADRDANGNVILTIMSVSGHYKKI